ncbi:MAG: autotransporter domain-containing protein [Methylacidiphilales bacterium]|nr:autotransporter domain-containing protein [Candidatus Methylacidiphilales bacterium]
MSGSSVTLAPGTGNTVTIGDVADNTNPISDVADDTIYSLPTGQSYTAGNAVTSSNPGGILNIGGGRGGRGGGHGGGLVILYGNNTYAGGTVITNGTTLEVSQDSNLGAYDSSNALVGNLTLDGGELLTNPLLNGTGDTTFTTARGVTLDPGETNILAAVTGTTATYSGILSGSNGALTIGDSMNAGTVILNGSNTYTGATVISAGTLAMGTNGSIASSSEVDLTNSGTTFDISSGGSQSIGDLSGTNGSTVSLGGNNLTVTTSATNTFAGTIADGGLGGGTGGSLTVTGTGELILTGSNSYSGGTTITTGTLEAGSSSALGTGNVTLNGGTLEATYGTALTVNVSSGSYLQTGGDLVINAYSATSNDKFEFGGTANITGGDLVMNFSGFTTATNNLSYTILTAAGGVTAADFTDATNVLTTDLSSTLKAVATISTSDDSIIVDTELIQLPFSTLPGADLNPNQLAVALYLDSHDQNITNPGFQNLIGALNGLSGNPGALGGYFDQLTGLNFANFASSTAFNNASFWTEALDSYLANHRGADGTFVSSQGGIDTSGLAVNDPNIDPGLQTVYSRLLAWSPAPSTGLLSDTPAMDLGGVDMKNCCCCSACQPDNLWNVFVSGNVVLAQDFSDAFAGTAHADATTGAVQAGADFKITPHLLVGATFAYGHTSATLDDIGSTASVDTYSPGIYASYANNGWYANALGSYGFDNYNQDRNVSIGTFGGTATSHPGGDQIVGDLDGGYDFHREGWTFGPTLGVQYVHLDVDGYTESGLPGDNLTVNQDEADSLRSSLGGRINYAIRDCGLVFNPHLSASWQHEFMDQSRGITSQFDGIGAGSFVVNTPNPSRDSALIDVGLDAQINNALTVFTDYTVQAGQSNYFGQSIEAGFKIGF